MFFKKVKKLVDLLQKEGISNNDIISQNSFMKYFIVVFGVDKRAIGQNIKGLKALKIIEEINDNNLKVNYNEFNRISGHVSSKN